MKVLTLPMKARIPRRRETRKEDLSVPIATNIITMKTLALKINWTS